MSNSCLIVLVQTYTYFFIPSRDFLKFLSLSPTFFLCKEMKFLCWHMGLSAKARDPQMPTHVPTTGYLFSTNILLPTTGGLSCELLKLSPLKQCLSSLHLKPTTCCCLHSIQRKLADQTSQIHEELWAECLIPKPITRSAWLMPHDELLSPGCTDDGGNLDTWLKCSEPLCEGQTLTCLILQG